MMGPHLINHHTAATQILIDKTGLFREQFVLALGQNRQSNNLHQISLFRSIKVIQHKSIFFDQYIDFLFYRESCR